MTISCSKCMHFMLLHLIFSSSVDIVAKLCLLSFRCLGSTTQCKWCIDSFSHWTSSKFISPFQLQLRVCCLLFVPCFLQFQGMVAGEISKISAVNAWLCSVFLRFLFSALWRLSPPDWAGLYFIPLTSSVPSERAPGPTLSSLLLTCCLCSSAAKGGVMIRLSVQPALLQPGLECRGNSEGSAAFLWRWLGQLCAESLLLRCLLFFPLWPPSTSSPSSLFLFGCLWILFCFP